MLFDEKPKVTPDHPLYWLEEIILAGKPWDGNKENEHNAEHQDMKKIWNMPEEANLILPPAPSKEEGNRCYHLQLHLKYWKEKGLMPEIVQKYESLGFDKLEDIKVPNKTVNGESY